MLVNMTEAIGSESLISHLVINALSHELKGDDFHEIVEEGKIAGKEEDACILDVTLAINGRDVNIADFCERWQKRVEGMIADKAGEFIQKKFLYLDDLVQDIERAVKSSARKIPYDDFELNKS